MKHLLCIEDDTGKRIVELQTASSSIGRDPDNSIVINSREISRQHAVLLRVPQTDEANEHQFQIIDGNLQGEPSTNGLLINGVPRFSHDLRHGDEIIFSRTVDAHYFVVESESEVEDLLFGTQISADGSATISATSFMVPDIPIYSIDEFSPEHLASFPELSHHPIIELSMLGEVTYLNPVAIKKFPEIITEQSAHPLLTGVVELVEKAQSQQLTREVVLGGYTFEQYLNYIPSIDTVRIGLLDITGRKQAESVKALHRKLEAEFERRTQQFNDATDRLHREEKALLASYATNRALLNAIPDPMFRIDCAGNFVNFKTPKNHTLPFDPASCLDLHLSALLPSEAADMIQNCIDMALQTEEIQVMDFQFPVLKGPMLTGAAKAPHFEARIAVSAPDEVMVIFRDITERK